MGDLLYRLVQLRYEYFNELEFKDLDNILLKLDESEENSSESLIHVMESYLKNKKYFYADYSTDFGVAKKKAGLVDEPHNLESYLLVARHISDKALNFASSKTNAQDDWTNNWSKAVEMELNDRADNILLNTESK